LQNAGAKLLGTVLNKIEPHHDGYYRSSYRAYYGSHDRNGSADGKETLIPPPTDTPEDAFEG
ncbi:MAG: hypothetical protein ACRD3O_20755, partial [Terriglobia bacterium]